MHSTAGAVMVTVFVILQPELILLTLGCKADEMTVTNSVGSVECIPCERCPSGLELHPKCGSKITEEQKKHNPIECKPCKPGFFSNNWDVHPCKECHHCLNTQPVTKECTNMSDTVCGDKCGRGLYLEETSLDCQQCSCCCGNSKDIKIAKCINDNEPVTHQCTSHRHHECCKASPISTGGRGDTQSTLPVAGTVGIVVATIAGFVGMVLFVLWFCHRKQKRQITREDVHLNETPAAAQKQEPGLHVESKELRVDLPSYHEQSEESPMHGDANQDRMSNTGFVSSAPSTPDVHVKQFREKINENVQTTLTQPQQRQEIKRQTSTSSDSDKTELKRKRSSSISSIVSGISRKLSIRQGSFDDEALVHEEDVHLPENRLFKLSDLDLCETETVGKMLDNPGYSVGSTKQLATHYNMKKLDIKDLTRESKPGEKVLAFINAKYPNLTVYEFCQVLHGESFERNDIVEELCDYLHKIDTRRTSDGNKSYV